jgi:hypothetical protein
MMTWRMVEPSVKTARGMGPELNGRLPFTPDVRAAARRSSNFRRRPNDDLAHDFGKRRIERRSDRRRIAWRRRNIGGKYPAANDATARTYDLGRDFDDCRAPRRIEFETAYAGLETDIREHAGPANRAQKMRVLKALDEPALNQRRQFIGPLRAGEISDGLRIGAHDNPVRVGGESRVRQKNGELAAAGARGKTLRRGEIVGGEGRG